MATCTEAIDFGPAVGTKSIVQFSGGAFHNACLQENSKVDDSTGLRIHSGAHVAIRFLLKNPQLVSNQCVCELGCGTGVYGLVGTRGGSLSSQLTLTDGNTETVNLAHKNVQLLASTSCESRISCRKLLWGSIDAVDEFLQHYEVSRETSVSAHPSHHNEVEAISSGGSHHFDVVLGCELFYYRTNIEELLFTVIELTKSEGIFVHSHVFRRIGQDLELINYLHNHNWVTYETLVEHFIDQEELNEHPEWYNVHCLVSGSIDRMNVLLENENGVPIKSKWKLFTGLNAVSAESIVSDGESADASVDNGFLLNNLFSSR